ncbi:MAG: hypothetical protein DMG38_23975 [Acidobacteria bacterium]|nr:MAG: hypothetical protein DMG38_23975 [Acidobacteriota bacterium]
MRYQKRIFGAFGGILLAAANGFAQDSRSNPEPNSASASSAASAQSAPGSALSNALAAACAQNQTEFARFLTVRNKDSFSRMTPAARLALMKRFVLLGEPGKAAISANPSGRPIVRCETPGGTTEMQIGGADIHDNVAFLPLELQEATDSTGASAHQINMGLVREESEWKLLSLGVLLLDLPALEVEWDESEIEATEKDALESLKTITSAVESYRKKYLRLPESLANLAPPARGKPSAEAAGLLDSELAKGEKNGYAFRCVIAGASDLGAPAKYELSATPQKYGRTGRRSFFRDSNGGFHAADRQGAVGAETDPQVE